MTIPQELADHPTVRKLQEWNAAAVTEAWQDRGELTVVVPRRWIRPVCEFLRSDPELQFHLLSDLSAVDRFPLEPRFEVNYHLVSLARRDRLRLKVRVEGHSPVVETVTTVWPTANWHEREVFDLMGIR
ncbi:MAG: NADH-quinone oxidoreductase subunit C, partial [Firmicutes bacterium]|nr:NADH-quinone oxidoreductase subunit C [Bacillota bacterium]